MFDWDIGAALRLFLQVAAVIALLWLATSLWPEELMRKPLSMASLREWINAAASAVLFASAVALAYLVLIQRGDSAGFGFAQENGVAMSYCAAIALCARHSHGPSGFVSDHSPRRSHRA